MKATGNQIITHVNSVWAGLILSKIDRDRIRTFFAFEFGIRPCFLVSEMHITIYYAASNMPAISPRTEPCDLVLPTADSRLMVMKLGGDSPRADIKPGESKVGIRVQKKSAITKYIRTLRSEFYSYETAKLLGNRHPSTQNRNAFGPTRYQPHMTMLLPDNGIQDDLYEVGNKFRQSFPELRFENYEIRKGQRQEKS